MSLSLVLCGPNGARSHAALELRLRIARRSVFDDSCFFS
jgi:hypothetical protein